MKGLVLVVLVATASMPLGAWDFGGSLDTVNYADFVQGNPAAVNPIGILRAWGSWTVGTDGHLLIKGNITDNYTKTLGQGNPVTNSLTADLDYLVFSTGNLWVGRTDFRDFGATLLNTRLDGVQYLLATPDWDLKGAVGTSIALFKNDSTLVISEDDTSDRQVPEDLTNPKSLWTPPRLVADLEASFRQWIPDQTFHAALAGQLDLRQGEAKDGDPTPSALASRTVGAPVSTAYLGLGGEGRLAGPFYWNAWAYLGSGVTLTAVGPAVPLPGSKDPTTYQTFKTSYILDGLGSLDISLLLPDTGHLVVDLGAQMGSWDPDGAYPYDNGPVSAGSTTPSLYTGWVGISQVGGSLVFDPQPANMVVTQFLVSVKPWDQVQAVLVSYLFIRPTDGPIAENGLDPASADLYLGSEGDLTLLWRPTSDLGVSLEAGVFLPDTTAMTRTTEWKFEATGSLSF